MQPTNANKALWEKGDFTRIAETMRISGEELVATLGITPRMKILDLGCGDGTTAVPAAQLGAHVIGVDIADNLVAAGNARAKALRLEDLTFQQGDASSLDGIADASFDLVVSVFGAMFAPRPDDVAQEMVRVTKPGGRIIMGNWIPGDSTLVAQILKISAAYTPPPPEGFISPMTWGDEPTVIARFGKAGIAADKIEFDRESWVFRTRGPASRLLDIFRKYYGPTMNAYAAAKQDGREDSLHRDLTALFESQNRGGSNTVIAATFLKVTVHKN
ncbi:class I SAM-dependent methyltransferase [Sphingomonas sinipercae]|uniref:Class I SAM-dependent methyltransferase n=1 Tax=Sphingomonas sinipercae TaxID=2714944 RepID=A0A6G7ZPA5_9SPHN|nr:class I SAM-dependent methyltransferase [Sphingomonas sinipercae]QIL02827.1 class I SAM-dependent methyltransferase [Sphingomonas sinipercae]